MELKEIKNADEAYVFTSKHDMSAVELYIWMRFFVQHGIGATGRCISDQLPVVALQLVATGGLKNETSYLGVIFQVPKDMLVKFAHRFSFRHYFDDTIEAHGRLGRQHQCFVRLALYRIRH